MAAQSHWVHVTDVIRSNVPTSFGTGYPTHLRDLREPMQTSKPSTFGRYEILAELGRGAMGVVYKAYDPKINRLVAIKTVSIAADDPAEEQACRARFFREAEAAGRLSHPRIVPVFDVAEDPETLSPYIVMEYVAGRSLEESFSADGDRLPLNTGLQLIQEVAEALDYAHLQGVVHRDVKPSNILIGDDGHARIADFGIAQINVNDAGGSAWGTPAYMSPEQFRGDSVDGRSDLFSLGVILYRMLTGHRPFQGNSAMTVAHKVQNQEPLPAAVFNTELSPQLDCMVTRAIAKDPADRYQTGMELVLDLQRLRDGADSGISADGTSDRQNNRQARAAESNGTLYNSVLKTTEASLSKQSSAPSDQGIKDEKAVVVHLEQPWQQVGVSFLTLGTLALAFAGLWWVIPAPASDEITLPSVVPTASLATVVGLEAESANAPFIELAANAPSSQIGVTKNARSASTEKSPSCQLGIAVEHHFMTADISVSIDNHASYSHSLRGAAKTRVVLFKGVEGYLSDVVQLAPGDHQIRVRVLSADGSYDESGNISGTFAAGTERLLTVDFDKHNRGMRLAFVPSSAP